MIRQHLGRVLVGLYPPATRDRLAQEMLDTWLDATSESVADLMRESVQLGRGAAREHARATARRHTARTIADALCLATMIWIAARLAGILILLFDRPTRFGGFGLWLMLLWPILGCALLGYDRVAGIAGIMWLIGTRLTLAGGFAPYLLASELLPLLGFVVMAITPRHTNHDLRKLGWLLPALVISLVMQPASFAQTDSLGIVLLAVTSIVGLLIFAADPRLALASALVWAAFGLMDTTLITIAGIPDRALPGPAPLVGLLLAAPLTGGLTLVQLRRIRQRSD